MPIFAPTPGTTHHTARSSAPASSGRSLASPTQREAAPERNAALGAHAFGVIPVRAVLRPHDSSPAAEQQEASIYAQGRTPVRIGGTLAALPARPLGPAETGGHLREIQRNFGAEGVERSVRGLAATRGKSFAHSAAEQAGFSPAARSLEGGAIGSQVAAAMQTHATSRPLPDSVRDSMTAASGYDFEGIAIHDHPDAHRAASLLDARAFTVGRDIYFARNAYQPTTAAGMQLLAHEAAHAVQHGTERAPVNEHFRTADSGDRGEEEASHFADFIAGSRKAPSPPPLTPSTGSGRVQRAISFTHANDAFTTNDVVPNETAAGFRLRSDPAPSFQWDTEVTIHGVAGDPFANFQVGFLQVERVFYANVHWGSGANHTHRSVRPDHLPRRDAASAGSIFASDSAPYVRPAFAASGDVRSPSFNDTPQTQRFPWTNPGAGRTSTTGWFNYGDAFVTYLSARDTTAGTGAAAFRDLATVYWNLSIGGSFDTAQAVGSRVSVTSPGTVNHGGVNEGGSGEFPAIHGGTIANGHDTSTDS